MRLLHWCPPIQWFQTSPKMNKLDRKKLKNVLHYIIHQTMQDKVYKTHLWKILYFSDFDFYEKNNRLITNETYSRLDRGPAPRHFNEIVKELKNEKIIKSEKIQWDKGFKEKFFSLRQPNFLPQEEIEQIDDAIKKCSGMTAEQVSEYSHEDTPYKLAKKNENLDPEFVFYRLKKYSVA